MGLRGAKKHNLAQILPNTKRVAVLRTLALCFSPAWRKPMGLDNVGAMTHSNNTYTKPNRVGDRAAIRKKQTFLRECLQKRIIFCTFVALFRDNENATDRRWKDANGRGLTTGRRYPTNTSIPIEKHFPHTKQHTRSNHTAKPKNMRSEKENTKNIIQ